jgi:hypothetical protein
MYDAIMACFGLRCVSVNPIESEYSYGKSNNYDIISPSNTFENLPSVPTRSLGEVFLALDRLEQLPHGDSTAGGTIFLADPAAVESVLRHWKLRNSKKDANTLKIGDDYSEE